MKLYAQHGSLAGDKVKEGIERKLVDGVIYSPRDISFDNLKEQLQLFSKQYKGADLLFDPQYYTTFMASSEGVRLGNLLDDYNEYYRVRRRSFLEREKRVYEDIELSLQFQKSLQVTHLISPNVYIPQSLNSIEALISKNFIRNTAECYKNLKDKRPVFSTLAISRDALLDKRELEDFVNEITMLDERPHGFYLLVGCSSPEARADIFNADVIAAWMFLNHVLNLNGYEVINGYSDLIAPLLCSANGSAGASGWWSNLRAFSLNRYEPSNGGGRLPNQRYLSMGLLNRITYVELDALRKMLPDVLNNLPTDSLYDGSNGSEPRRNLEVIQSWDALRSLSEKVADSDQNTSLNKCKELIANARKMYDEIPIALETKSNGDHLDSLDQAIVAFRKLAEINSAAD